MPGSFNNAVDDGADRFRTGTMNLYNSGVPPDVAARLRMDAPVLLIGVTVWIVGAGALLMYALRRGEIGRLLLSFGAFSVLYGTRIVVDSVFARASVN
jgi:hypothetical protein